MCQLTENVLLINRIRGKSGSAGYEKSKLNEERNYTSRLQKIQADIKLYLKASIFLETRG